MAAGRYAAHGSWAHGGPLRGSWRAATRLAAGRYAARGGPLRGAWRAATRLVAGGGPRVAAQVYHTRPKLFYETQDRERTPLVGCSFRLKRAVLCNGE